MWDFNSHCTFLSKSKVVYPAVPFLWPQYLKVGFHFPQVPLGAKLSFIFYFHNKLTYTKQLSFSGIYSRSEQTVEERRGRSPFSWLYPSPMPSHHLSPKSGLGAPTSSPVLDAQTLQISIPCPGGLISIHSFHAISLRKIQFPLFFAPWKRQKQNK